VEEGVRAERILGVVVVDKSAIESPTVESQPTQQYLRFTQFVEEPACTKKLTLRVGMESQRVMGWNLKHLRFKRNPRHCQWKVLNAIPSVHK
jgi:hypothetical protein